MKDIWSGPAVGEIHIGIDPGLDGGIAVLNNRGEIIDCKPMLVTEEGTVDSVAIYEWLSHIGGPYTDPYLTVEKVWGMPEQGISSTFKFGRVTGQIIGVTEVFCNRTAKEISPQTWQRKLFGAVEDTKLAAQEFVSKKYPGINLHFSRKTKQLSNRVKNNHQGVVDSICIANYGWCVFNEQRSS